MFMSMPKFTSPGSMFMSMPKFTSPPSAAARAPPMGVPAAESCSSRDLSSSLSSIGLKLPFIISSALRPSAKDSSVAARHSFIGNRRQSATLSVEEDVMHKNANILNDSIIFIKNYKNNDKRKIDKKNHPPKKRKTSVKTS